jgi:diguanylate cyclase (GGDEF)-like protein
VVTRIWFGNNRPETIRPIPRVPAAGIALVFVALYLAGVWWGRELSEGAATTPWYPPPGLTVALVVAFGLRFAPLAMLAEGVGSVLIFDVDADFTALQIVVNALVIAAAYSVGPAILRAYAGNGLTLRKPSSYWLFMATCVVLGPALAALGGVGVREWADATGGNGYWESVRQWFVGDALGVVTIAPLALILLLERVKVRRLFTPRAMSEAAVLLGTGAATVLLDGDGTPRFVYLCLIPLAWIAYRHGLIGAAVSAAALNLEVVILADLALTAGQLEELQGLLGVVALTALLLGSLSSEIRRARRRISDASATDSTTGLASRPQLLNWLAADLGSAAERPAPPLVMVDIDRFSVVNDVRGHAVGDRLLKLIAERISEVVRFDARCARFGSDEFAVLLSSPDTDPQQLADQIVEAIARPFDVDGEPVAIRAHAGIAVPADGDRPGDVIRGACLALQRASEDQRPVAVLDATLREQSHHRHVLENDLPEAIAEGRLAIVYQPIVWLDDDGVEAYEALLRWNHPNYGGVPPLEVIELAQRSGLMNRLSEFVLRQACEQIAVWEKAGREVNVGVNITAADLMVADFADRAQDLVRRAGIEPSRITFELTEQTAISDIQRAQRAMQSLRAEGFLLAIDDFGSGYSSLTYLERLPVNAIKLDRELVARITGDSRSDAVLQAIVPLSQALGFKVVGEGVETPLQLELLSELGCDAIQGYLLGTPRPPAECVPDHSLPVKWPLSRV